MGYKIADGGSGHTQSSEEFVVGRKAITRNNVLAAKHHGVIIRRGGGRVAIQHAKGCCEAGIVSTLDIEKVSDHWRVIIERSTAWDRIMADD